MAKYLGLGVTLHHGGTSGTSYTNIAQIMDINGPTGETTDVQVTTRDSSDVHHEFLAGWINGGELTFDVVWDPALATHETLVSAWQGRASQQWRANFTSVAGSSAARRAAFNGYVKAVGPASPLEDKMTCSVGIKVTGKVTFESYTVS